MNNRISRRQFLRDFTKKISSLTLLSTAPIGLSSLKDKKIPKGLIDNRHIFEVKEAMYYTKLGYN